MKKLGALCATVAMVLCSNAAQAVPFSSGDIFAAISNGKVAHYDHGGTLLQTLDSGLGGYTTGMAFDGSGNLYSTNFSAGSITRYDANGAILPPNPYISGLATPESIAFAADGSFYVGTLGSSTQHYSSAGTLLQTYSMGRTDWLDLAANQTTLFYNDESGTIRRWDLTTDTALPDFANNNLNGGTESFALRILANGDVLSAADSLITQYDSAGLFLGSYDVTGVDGFFALNLDPDGTHFWSGSFENGSLYEFLIGGFGADSSITSFNTGVGSSALFGVALAGEITAGGPPTDGAVPEPSTWAMLLLGFGTIGYQMRKTRSIKVKYQSA
ncbi:hypothetical protein GCM10022276_14120 [Sphingomonas limnosediminicola]|uniref:Ice-binding protein C-terminal domain-containing protein n=1 Tax=Sphingomonas limnosediminicola TaxID=940133 RepID=A0ABP7L8Y3_9SPHN